MGDSALTPRVVTRTLGGGALTRAALAGALPEAMFARPPRTPAEWRERCTAVREDFAARDWLGVLAPALMPGGAAAARLERVAREGGVVITTGQQPGLFGGPAYTWYKAYSALALADQIQRATGIAAAPVFWAATDDADIAEASVTYVTFGRAVHELRMNADLGLQRSLATVPLPDVASQLATLRLAAGSAAFSDPLDVASSAYREGETVGSAYVKLLRALLAPLGVAVLDAAHPAVAAAALPTLRSALREAAGVAAALRIRTNELERAGFRAQVQDVPHLSLVFRTIDGERRRVPISGAADAAAATSRLGPNVLLRPIVERQILPTAAYVAGPAEIAYFAQLSAVTSALALPVPLAVPRWSGVVIEPEVRATLEALGLEIDDLADPHAALGSVAREEMDPAVRSAIADLRAGTEQTVARLVAAAPSARMSQRVPAGFGARVARQIARLQRRYAAAVKNSDNARVARVVAARASLFPNDGPQERVLNLLPMLARYGPALRDALMAAAASHAATLVAGDGATPSRAGDD